MSKTKSKIAYQILREEPDCDLIFKGINFFECTRFFLWDSIGRASRASSIDFQHELKYLKEYQENVLRVEEPTYNFVHLSKLFLKSIGKKKGLDSSKNASAKTR